MKALLSLKLTRRDLNVFIACLLSFSLLMMPFVPIAAAASRGSERQSRVNRDKSSQVSTTMNVTAANAPLPAPAPEPLAVGITASKVDSLIGDDGDNKADPAGTEKIQYDVTITNGGSTDATGVTYSDTIDAHTTLVGGSVNTQPIADPDNYAASGNIAITIAAPGVLNNDRDPDTGNATGLTVTKVQGVGANVGVATDTVKAGNGGVKGSVTLNANGSFTYEPPPGYEGTGANADSFTYEISDGTKTDTATVTIDITGMVWFISNNSGGSNRGTFTNPFTSIASFNTANVSGVAPAPKNGDFISLRLGTGTYNETDGVNLRPQQKLIGNAIQFNTVFTASTNSIAAYTTFAGGTTAAPLITTTAGNGIDLAADNVVRGLNVGNTPAFFKFNGGAVGSPVINAVSLTGTGGALNVSTSGTFAANVTFGTFESTSSPTSNLNLVNVTGTLGVTTFATGLSGSAASSAAINISGGSVGFSYGGNVTKNNAGALLNVGGGHTGTLTFATGTLNASNGTGLQFDNADGTYNFNGTTTLNGGDAGVDILNGSSGSFTFASGTTITSPTGIAFNVGTSPGNPTVSYAGTITQNSANRLVNVDGTTGSSISFTDGSTGLTAGASSTGININNANGNVTFTKLTLGTSGGRMTNQAVTINGGTGTYGLGTVSIFTTGARGVFSQDANGTLNITAGSVDTTAAAAGATAAAFNIDGPAGLTTLGISLTSVNVNNSTLGIMLQDTDGSFTVAGTATGSDRCGGSVTVNAVGTPATFNATVPAECTGGTISNITTSGVQLTNASNVSLSRMTFNTANTADGGVAGGTCSAGNVSTCNGAIDLTNATNITLSRINISGTEEQGIVGSNVTGFSLSNSNVQNAGDEADENGVYFLNLFGTVSITGTRVTASSFNNLGVLNDGAVAGSTLNMTVTGSMFTSNSSIGGDGIVIDTRANTTSNINVGTSTFTANKDDHFNVVSSSNAVTNVTFKQNTLTGGHATPTGQGIALRVAGPYSGTYRFDVDGNSVKGAIPTAINTGMGSSTSAAVMHGTIRNNIVGTSGVALSGSAQGSCILAENNGVGQAGHATPAGTYNVLITNNTLRRCFDKGIDLLGVRDGNNTLNVTVSLNNVDELVDVNSRWAVRLETGSSLGDETGNVCADIINNTLNAATIVDEMSVRARSNATLRFPGYTGGATSTANLVTYLQGRNPAGGTATVNPPSGTSTFNNTIPAGSACTQPTLPTLPSAPVVSDAAPALKRLDGGNAAQHAGSGIGWASAPQPSLISRAFQAVAQFANGVMSMVEPTAHAAELPAATAAAPAVQVAYSRNEPVAVKTVSQVSNSSVQKTTNTRKVVSNHARSSRGFVPTTMVSGENVTVNIGTLRAGDSVTITFQVTVNNPPALTLLSPARVRNQGTVSGTNFSDVLTDDPALGGGADPTDTPVDLFDSKTNLISSLNPANQGDSITFTATVAIDPAQTPTPPSPVTPTGTVTFKSDGVDIGGCVGVAVDGSGQAQCTTSALTPPSHNITAVYSGDGNYDPSTSNTVSQTVIACATNPIVTSTADAGAGSLRDAVANVCNNNTITFNIAGAGPHTITLTSGEIPVAKNVTIKNNSGERITVSGNNASRVFNVNSGKTVAVVGLTLSGGSSTDGGAVLNDGALTIVNSTLSGNAASADGGAISTTATGTALTLINTTISGNHAGGSGGGLITLGGTVSIINTTITNNTADFDNNNAGDGGGIRAHAGTVTLKNTIVAGNLNADGGPGVADDVSGTLDTTAAASFNLIGTGGSGGLTNGVNNNQVGVANAGLGALADNGGLVDTHALLSTSAAIETGGNANLPADTFDLDGDANVAEALPVDGRGLGFPRNADSFDVDTIQVVDIGAFELHPSIENIADQSTNEDTVKNVSFNIGDDTGSLIATVTATSSNTTLVPNANLLITGSGGSRNLQITPASNQSGTTTITVTVTATNGRTAVDTFDLTVNSVNDPPSGTDNTVTTAEDTAYTFTAADFGFSDPNDTPPNTFFAVKITTLPGLGTLTNNNVPVNAGDFISVANINAGLLKFTPAPDGFGTPYTTFTFQVQDAGAGTDLDPTPNTMTINVTGVNDAPVNTVPGPQVTDEDVALVFSSGNGNQISVADSDAGANPIKVTLTATNGTLTLSTTAGLVFITGDGTADATMMFTGTLTAVNTALNGMSFTGTANFSGAASLQIVSDDQGNTGSGGPLTDTDSVNITINAVNDPPSGTDNTVSTAEDTAYTFTAADFGFSDPNDTPPNTLQAVKITTLPGLGTLTNNNVAVNAGDFISVANINGGLLKFTPAADGNGTPYTTFTFQVQDNGGGTDLDPTPNTMTINVTAVNDAPVNTVPGPQSTTEDTPKVFSAANLNQISVADVDAGSNPIKITLTATNGTITLSTTAGLVFITGDGTADATMMFTGTLTAVNTAMNGMSFTPTLDFNGAASLQIVSDDQGNSGSGGPLTDTDTVNITVNAANDPPIVTTTGGNLSYTENDPATAIDTGLTVTDVDSANLVGATVAITSGFVAAQDTLSFTNQNGISGSYNSGTGVLTLSGSSSVANYQTALRSVKYQNSSDNPTTSRTVTFIADDGSSTSSPATRGITITAVNDAPVNTVPGGQSTNQNTPLVFSAGNGNQISVADVDAGTNAVQVTLTATNGTLTLSGTSGLAFTVGDGTADATMTFTGTIANVNTALNGMTFTPTAGFSGAATLTITTNDQGNSGSGGPLSDTDVVNIQVATEVSIQDASLVEPKNNTTDNMIFTVTLSAPAPAGGSSVNYTTVQEAPALNHATAGQDYTTTSGTVNFAAGEQFKTISVQILGDNKNNEANETFQVVLSSPSNLTIADGTATGTILITNNAGAILIGELRTSGPGGSGDDFVEIYNNSDNPHVVSATDGSNGYGLFKMGAACGDTPVLVGFIPNGTTIPGRGHYLFAGPAYSLGAYGAADQTVADIENDRNVGIFSTSVLAHISTANRLDAVGFGSNTGLSCDLLREGTTLTPLVGSVLEYSYFRDECGKSGNPSQFGPCPTNGATKDSNDNASDLIFVETTGAVTVAGQRLGAPGPQGLGSPRKHDDIFTLLLDATKGANGIPNRERNNSIVVPNGSTGTLSIRRRFVNSTGAPVTRLRFRIVDISALTTGGGNADLRAISSGPVVISGIADSATCQASNGSPVTPCTVTVQGTTLEQPPNQPIGGALNSSWNAGTITLGTPLANGASINIQLVLGVEVSGSFKFFFNIEALP